jgi:4-amino-4-deoxy-L-arabinose transferase-like glycosyltransferase
MNDFGAAVKRLSPAWWITGFTLLLHLSVANRYDFFRDEMYFIVCGRHPAFGYVDQPPLVPLIAAATQLFGHSLFALRAVAALAAAASVYVTCRFVVLCGGGRFAQALAGIAVALSPIYLGIESIFTTSTFEPLSWTLVAYFAARAQLLGERRWWLWAGIVGGLSFETKYGILPYLVSIVLGMLLTPARGALRTREFWAGAGLCAAIAAPNVVWQAVNGWPFAQFVHAELQQGRIASMSPAIFIVNQMLVMDPLTAPIWIAGIIAPWRLPRLRPLAFLSVAFVAVFAIMLAGHAKDYYLVNVYPVMFAIGAVLLERGVRLPVTRALYAGACVAVSLLAIPAAMPIMNPEAVVSYVRAAHLEQHPEETTAQSNLPQHFADEIGWRTFVAQIAHAYDALPAPDRARVALITTNYGEAAAIDFYGGAYGLPPALSGHNQYYLWGTHGYDGSVVLRINGNLALQKKMCRDARIVGSFGSEYVLSYESDRPIILCRGLHPPLAQLWPKLKHYN